MNELSVEDEERRKAGLEAALKSWKDINMKPMNPKYKKLWLEALRSGKYEQTVGVLNRIVATSPEKKVGHCCLGVLCEVSDKCVRMPAPDQTYAVYEYEGSTMFERIDPFLEEVKLNLTGMHILMKLNDECYATFNEIADWIEKNL